MKKFLITATVQSHICQFHKPLIDIMKRNGYEVHVAARNNLDEKNGLRLDFADNVFDIPFERSPFSFKNIEAYKALKKIIDSGEYDIISCNTPVGGILTRMAAAGKRKNGTKVFYTAHGFHFYKGAPIKNWLLYYPVEWFYSLFTDAIITINEEDFRLAKKNFRCRVERIHGVGVDPERYYPVSDEEKNRIREELGYSENDKIILCVGELLPNKNQGMLIDAMKLAKRENLNVKVLFAGNGPERECLEKIAKENGLEKNIDFLGYCTILEKYQKASDISVSCSIREGLGLNLIEAMLSGNPIVATSNRGHDELVVSGVNGFLVKIGEKEKLAEKLLCLIDDPESAEKMGLEGLNAAKKYSTPEVKKELEAIFLSGQR